MENMSKRKQQAAARKIRLQQRALDTGRAYYKKADELLEQLVTQLGPGAKITIGPGQVAEVVDNFAGGKNKAWKPCGVNRFDIKVSRAIETPV